MTDGVVDVSLTKGTHYPNEMSFRLFRIGRREFLVDFVELSSSNETRRVTLRIVLCRAAVRRTSE